MVTTIGFVTLIMVVAALAVINLRMFRVIKDYHIGQDEIINVKAQIEQTQEKVFKVSLDTNNVQLSVDRLPQRVLDALKGSTNKLRGDLGEFIQFTKMKADYDSILSIGDIVDYMAIKFPTEGDPGCIDFIEVKTNSARLSPSQKIFRDLVAKKLIGFKSVKVMLNEFSKDNPLNGGR